MNGDIFTKEILDENDTNNRLMNLVFKFLNYNLNLYCIKLRMLN